MWKKYRAMACMGIVGAALFGVGYWLIYLYPGLALQNDIQPLWAEMPAWRFVGSAWCGIIGGMIMMYGAYSAWMMINDNSTEGRIRAIRPMSYMQESSCFHRIIHFLWIIW